MITISFKIWHPVLSYQKAAKVSKQPPLIYKHVYFVQWAKYKDLYRNEKSPSKPKNLNQFSVKIKLPSYSYVT